MLRLAPLAAALSGCAASASGPVKIDCPAGASTAIARKAQLPRGAAAAIGFPMAEAGARFNTVDVVTDETRGLPFARFIAARRCGGVIAVDYEQGGIALFKATLWLRRTGKGWARVKP